MDTADKITICHLFKIFINAKNINETFAIIEIDNNSEIITGKNTYNLYNREDVYSLWYRIEDLYNQYFNKILEKIPVATINQKIEAYINQ